MKIEENGTYLWVKRKFMKGSKKSIVRMIASYVLWKTNKQEPRKRRKFNNRSLVRMIASKLPLKPSKRAYFQVRSYFFIELNCFFTTLGRYHFMLEGVVASWCNPAELWCQELSVVRVQAQPWKHHN